MANELRPCVICHGPTPFRCLDCAIGRTFHPGHPDLCERRDVVVCGRIDCREAHEALVRVERGVKT